MVCRTHPGKAVALWGHLALLMSCPTRSTVGWWRNYNLSLRHGYSSAEEADFALNQCLYTQAMVESSEALQSPSPPVVLPVAPPRVKKRKVYACFAWNDAPRCLAASPTAAHGTVVSTPGDCGGGITWRFCPPGRVSHVFFILCCGGVRLPVN